MKVKNGWECGSRGKMPALASKRPWVQTLLLPKTIDSQYSKD
jgi:hypothetical protein